MLASLHNLRTGKTFALTEPATILGRDPRLWLCVNDAGVSRRHAVLSRYPGGFMVSDLGSRNGVFVNGVQVDREAGLLLRDGDEVTLGETVFLFSQELGCDTTTLDLPVLDPGDSSELWDSAA